MIRSDCQILRTAAIRKARLDHPFSLAIGEGPVGQTPATILSIYSVGEMKREVELEKKNSSSRPHEAG